MKKKQEDKSFSDLVSEFQSEASSVGIRNDAAIAAMQAALTAHLLSMPMPTPKEAGAIAGQCYVMADAMVAASLVAREGVASGVMESQRLQQERGGAG